MAAEESGSSAGHPLLGRVAIVTGGAGEIGGAIAAHLAALGAHVVISYFSGSGQADRLVGEINASPSPSRAIAVKADVSKAADVKALFDAAEETFGGAAHILVACAGVLDSKYPTLAATPEEDWDKAFAVNAKGTFLCCREAANRLVRGGGGRIVTISTGLVKALQPHFAAYTASKAAVEATTKILAKELRGTQITANCVAPGPMDTEMFHTGLTEDIVKMIVGMVTLGRLGKPEEIAAVVGFLTTDAGGWVHGQVIGANGGFI
ncbi:unnamed protein product [Spirodela intermedia]|uniref:Uncharacterized protein n=1 Tax=Spirodela intermedia TaxID=51605 RepID=A0A7I8KAZ5_SPIIN|nr:unnamed protein product [Spirodela intermedia]